VATAFFLSLRVELPHCQRSAAATRSGDLRVTVRGVSKQTLNYSQPDGTGTLVSTTSN
jgi:hypothetical protein